MHLVLAEDFMKKWTVIFCSIDGPGERKLVRTQALMYTA